MLNITDTNLLKATRSFGFESPFEIILISNGLINSTFKVSDKFKTIILQKLNHYVFKQPEDIVNNYLKIYDYLKNHTDYSIPAPVKTIDHDNYFRDEAMNCWRATCFIEGTFTPEIPKVPEEAYLAAISFGNFTKALSGFNISELKTIIPKFHDLAFRYEQFLEALKKGSVERKEKAANEIEYLKIQKSPVDFYTGITTNPEYRLRVMHHDAKLSNILFDQKTNKVICPVDFDTIQPGYFFSDLGDMIRSMACTQSESSVDFSSIDIHPDFYKALMNGYKEAIKDEFTVAEKKNIHYSGLIMIYMQALRYMTDYLNNDIYYRIEYKEQNFDRAKNQLVLLKKLEGFLKREYQFSV